MKPAEAKKFLAGLTLKRGGHESPDEGLCVMEAVAYVSGEPFSYHPTCASRVVAEFCIRLNDRWSDEQRQKLKPFVFRIAGTAADDATERKRAYMCADWAVRECLPMALESAKVKDWPERLRALPEIVDAKTAQAGRAAARKARKAADAAYADTAAQSTAAADAADAYAAADAAADAAYVDTTSAAAAAADAAYAAKARASALSLLDRLIAVTEKPRKTAPLTPKEGK